MPTASSLAWKTLSRKVRTLVLQWLRSVALYLWLIVVISVRQSTVAAISGLHCRALAVLPEHKADSLIAKFKEAGGTVREIDVWAESPRLSPPLVICIIVCLSWAVNHYRDNAITYKAQRDKNARELKLANAAITDMQMCVSVMSLRLMQNTRSELADAKAENDALRDDAAGRRRLHIKAVCQSVREATTASGVDNAALPRLADTAERIYFTLREVRSLCKNNWKEPRSILMSSADRVRLYRWATHAIIVSNTHCPAEYKCLSNKTGSNSFTNVCWVSCFATIFSAPPQILAASTVFFLPNSRNEEMMGDGFFGATAAGLFWTVNVCWVHP